MARRKKYRHCKRMVRVNSFLFHGTKIAPMSYHHINTIYNCLCERNINIGNNQASFPYLISINDLQSHTTAMAILSTKQHAGFCCRVSQHLKISTHIYITVTCHGIKHGFEQFFAQRNINRTTALLYEKS